MAKQYRDEYGLTLKHRKVLDLYLTCCLGNIKEAYSMVYPDASPVTVGVNAYKVLNQPEAKRYVEMMREKVFNEDFVRHFINSNLYEISVDKKEQTKDRIAAMRVLSQNMSMCKEKENTDKDITITLDEE